ncbi:hypothetical protein HPB52_021024 [Rhipicephalus sanguineus]|uniref:Uncharacterized protein n=1 Tax=Rhipicephalus sanguineus TaxID=34632 RepID=A0A9D4T2N8_RHISA|nr:hypothetical protein HPB52_021024 [Rhipicephalus sanguineus]
MPNGTSPTGGDPPVTGPTTRAPHGLQEHAPPTHVIVGGYRSHSIIDDKEGLRHAFHFEASPAASVYLWDSSTCLAEPWDVSRTTSIGPRGSSTSCQCSPSCVSCLWRYGSKTPASCAGSRMTTSSSTAAVDGCIQHCTSATQKVFRLGLIGIGLQSRLMAATIHQVLPGEMGTGLQCRLSTAATRKVFLQGLGHIAHSGHVSPQPT